MKTVFSSLSEVAHVWAQQDQQEGRNQSQSLYFYNKNIYSYGSHYLLGQFIEANDGSRAVMINDRGYSSSTGRHINIVQGATRHYKQFYVKDTNFQDVKEQLLELINKLKRARKPELYILPANELMNKYKAFLHWMYDNKLNKDLKKQSKELDELLSIVNGDLDLDVYVEKVKKLKAKQARAEQRKRVKAAKEAIQRFYNYENYSVYGLPFELLRVSQDGNFIETSQHVRIDIKACKVLYNVLQSGKDVRGYRIDRYTVISQDENILHIGCHRITKAEIKKIAKQLNW